MLLDVHKQLNDIYGAITRTTSGNNKNQSQPFIREITRDISQDQKTFIITINLVSGTSHSLTIPLPHFINGIWLIEHNGVKRALSNFYNPFRGGEAINLLSAIHMVLTEVDPGLIEKLEIKKYALNSRLNYGIANGRTSETVNLIQKHINELIEHMPLHNTMLESWVVNNRLIIMDKNFRNINSPEELLTYQLNKNAAMFPHCSSMGIADQSAAIQNYILNNCDLRMLMPYGLTAHNPARNLYSTTGMKGDDIPKIMSQKEKWLLDQGIVRGGWNLTTVFADVDTPNGVTNYQDLILVDNSLQNLNVKYKKSILIYNQPVVEAGDILKFKDKLSKNEKLETRCEIAKVNDIKPVHTTIGDKLIVAYKIEITYFRKFKNGFKFTNRSANKGIIRFADLGYTINPKTNEKEKIQVLCSTNTKKRKNFSQILEALMSNVFGTFKEEKEVVVNDWACETQLSIEKQLNACGLPEDGCWECHVPGLKPFRAITGEVFWGVIKTPEDMIYEEGDTDFVDARKKRKNGVKFSTIETSAAFNLWGYDNAVVKELFGYQNGFSNINEYLKIIRSSFNIFDNLPKDIQCINPMTMNVINDNSTTLSTEEGVVNTIADSMIAPHGAMLQLPIPFKTVYKDRETVYSGIASTNDIDSEECRSATTEYIYIPNSALRKCWMHPSGYYGVQMISVIINNIIKNIQLLVNNNWLVDPPIELPEYTVVLNNYITSLKKYFKHACNELTGKKGAINSDVLSVRHPHSAKGVACQRTDLGKNTICIHSSMAKLLRVKTGDVVLVERYPCLGYMGLRPQYVKVTNEELDRYVIYANKEDLGSTGLDFDGDTLYIYAFYSPEAIELLRNYLKTPTPFSCNVEILNRVKGEPKNLFMELKDYGFEPFPVLTAEKHDEIIRKVIGVKAQTGPVVNLMYNLFRLLEEIPTRLNMETKADIGVFLEKAGQSVFEQKHGTAYSLCDIVKEALYSGNEKLLVDEGFNPGITNLIVRLIKHKAAQIGIAEIGGGYYEKNKNGYDIVSKIIDEHHKFYTITRRQQSDGIKLLSILESVVNNDVATHVWENSLNSVYTYDKHKHDVNKRNADIKAAHI